MATSFPLLSIIIFSSLLTACLSVCHPNDNSALMKIKKGLNNPHILSSWLSKTDCCSWYGIRCDPTNNRVVELGISNAEISARIPPAIGSLPYLETLILRRLNLTGTFPLSIIKLEKLKTLRVGYNHLSDPIPSFISALNNLEILELDHNDFSGVIPNALFLYSKLRVMRLDRNKLVGVIPEPIVPFEGKNVPDLYFSHNQLRGPIPKSFATMDFKRIDLSQNNLVGDASPLFKPNGSTEILNISRNMFEFDFSKVQFPTTLFSLYINHNKIYGSIPNSIVSLENLQTYNVSYNALCGKIPTGANMFRFGESTYMQNKCLCGKPLKSVC